MKDSPSLPILVAISLAFAQTIAAPPSGDVRLDKAIEKANTEFITATKTGDAATIAAPYGDNAVFVLTDGSSIQGRAEIEKMYRTRFEQSGSPNSTKLDSKNVILDGEIAYEIGKAEVTVMREGKPVTKTSRYLTVWQRTADGDWKIIRNIVLS